MKRVYFIKPIGMDGPIKIGCSQSPDGRRCTLESWSPFALEVIAEIDGDFAVERKFHKAFHHLHQRREWFASAPDLLAVIAAINAGTFDVKTLAEVGNISPLWRARRARPSWCGKQAALTRMVGRAEWFSGYRCPVRVRDAYNDQRHDDIALARQFADAPKTYGTHDPEMLWSGSRREYWSEKAA
jgi:hypothetical protein